MVISGSTILVEPLQRGNTSSVSRYRWRFSIGYNLYKPPERDPLTPRIRRRSSSSFWHSSSSDDGASTWKSTRVCLWRSNSNKLDSRRMSSSFVSKRPRSPSRGWCFSRMLSSSPEANPVSGGVSLPFPGCLDDDDDLMWCSSENWNMDERALDRERISEEVWYRIRSIISVAFRIKVSYRWYYNRSRGIMPVPTLFCRVELSIPVTPPAWMRRRPSSSSIHASSR